ncbi:MAG: SDR family NAD(P)-dependent oxidoreductase [Anaerolineales bacterium]
MERTVLITGAMGGIGFATAEAFLEDGWLVFGLDVNAPAKSPKGMRLLRCDLSVPEEIERAFAEISNDTDRVEAIVNNAAVQICKPLVEMSVDEWDLTMATNLRPAFLALKYGYSLLKKAKGAIVNVSSVHAVATSKNIAAYAASKGGMVALTRAMAIELAGDGIRVNAVLPGAVNTGMLRDGLRRGHVGDGTDEELLQALGDKTVMGRVGEPSEIARAILFLADSEQSAFMTGHAMIVDGGATIRLSTE